MEPDPDRDDFQHLNDDFLVQRSYISGKNFMKIRLVDLCGVNADRHR